MNCGMPDFPVLHYLPEFLKLMSIELVMPSNHLILCCHLLSCPKSFLASGSFPMSRLFTSGGQSVRTSASTSVLPMNIWGLFPLKSTGLISLQFKGLSRVFCSTTTQNINTSVVSLLYGPTLTSIHDYWKNHSFTRWIFVGKVMSLLFNTVSRFAIAFLPRSSFSSFNFVAAVTVHSDFGAQENKICHCFHCFPIYLPWSDGTECHDLQFLNAEL